MVVDLSVKLLSQITFVLLVYAGRNIKAFIVPINDYKKENKDERKIDKKYRNRLLYDRSEENYGKVTRWWSMPDWSYN